MATTSQERDDGAGSDRLRAKNPMEFIAQVRQEGRKVTWATWAEVRVSTIMVMVMVIMASIFFFAVDSLIRLGVGFLLPR